MKKGYAAGIAMLILFGAIALFSLKEGMTPYVKFEEARRCGKTVQIAGRIVQASAHYRNDGALSFSVENPEGEKMEVVFGKTKPANFDQASEVVVRGRFMDGLFRANHLLIKCPSKYQERLKDPAEAEKFYQSGN